jgi:hypothetical protein
LFAIASRFRRSANADSRDSSCFFLDRYTPTSKHEPAGRLLLVSVWNGILLPMGYLVKQAVSSSRPQRLFDNREIVDPQLLHMNQCPPRFSASSHDPETGFEEITGDVLEADFWTTSGPHPDSKRAVYSRSAMEDTAAH